MRRRAPSSTLLILALASLAACKSDRAASPCGGAEGGVTTGARTGVEGAKTGVETGVAGVKQLGSATAGLVEGGSGEAKSRWNEGKRETKHTAREGASHTKQEAHRCR
jgi:hypothetical protein